MTEASPAAQAAAWLIDLERRLARLEHAIPSSGHAAKPRPTELAISEADIRAAYRLLLGREVDGEGLATYRRRAAEGLRPADLVMELLGSDERAVLAAANIVQVDVGEVKVCVDRSEREFGRTIAADGVWEAHVVAQIMRILPAGGTFVDIGANIGVMSFQAARKLGPNGKVIAFEPNPDNVQRFLEGVMANGMETQIRLIPLAASSGTGVFAIRGGSNSYLTPAASGMRLAASVAADELLATEERVDLIKIDIEGHEPAALAGLVRTIVRHRPKILCEFNPRCLNASGRAAPDAFATQLFSLGSRVEIIEHDGSLSAIADAAALMEAWARRDAEHVARGDLPPGMVHFDLLIECDAR